MDENFFWPQMKDRLTENFRAASHSLRDWFPHLTRSDRIDLINRLEAGSHFNADFLMLLSLSAVLASLGLLQGSTAVVIGAMVVAPLMTPLIAAGLAIVHGNFKLFRSAIITMVLGVAVGLVIAIVVGNIVPGDTLTEELFSRGKPTLVDLGVAFFSGVAASYAMARPNVISALAGVAIAAALVPPLVTVGLTIAKDFIIVAIGASILLASNLVAIILGAAVTFRIVGVKRRLAEKFSFNWARYFLLSLTLAFMALLVPLGIRTAAFLDEGSSGSLGYPISPALWRALNNRLETESGIGLLIAGRPSQSVSKERGFDIGVILSASRPVTPAFKEEVVQLVKKVRGKEQRVKLTVVREADDKIKESPKKAEKAIEKPVPKATKEKKVAKKKPRQEDQLDSFFKAVLPGFLTREPE